MKTNKNQEIHDATPAVAPTNGRVLPHQPEPANASSTSKIGTGKRNIRDAESTIEIPTPIPTAIEIPTQVEPVRAPVEVIETPKTLEEYAEAISEMYKMASEADKESKIMGRQALDYALKTGEWLNEVKSSGMVPFGKWEKWVTSCKGVGLRTAQKWMHMAGTKTNDRTFFEGCPSLHQGEIWDGQRPSDLPKKTKDGGIIDKETEESVEVVLNKMRIGFEGVSRQYDILTKLDPGLNSFLLGKGYSNDLPLLLQQWQSSLSDAFAYFNLPPVEPNVCVRCGHVREWDEVFVPIPAYYNKQHLQGFNLWCQACEADCKATLPNVNQLAEAVTKLKFVEITNDRDRAKQYIFALKSDQRKHYKIKDAQLIKDAEANEWSLPDLNNEPAVIAAIEKLSPRIEFADTPQKKQIWEIYRHFVSSAPYNRTVGGFQFLVMDGNKVLGLGGVSNDSMSLEDRDKFIGWTLEQRHEEGGKLCNIVNASVIVPTEIFGSNFLGGKLMASLITSHVIRDKNKELHGYTLAGLTTTSLFGVPSMYDQVDEWKRLGKTKGKVPIEPPFTIYEKWKQFLKETRTHANSELLKASSTNQKGHFLAAIYKAAGVSDYEHGLPKGLYFAELYENTRDFLCSKIGESELKMKPLYAETVEQITDRWRKKAIKRYQKLKKDNELTVSRKAYSNQLNIGDLKEGG